MDCRVMEIGIYRQEETQPLRVINAGPFPIDADEAFECIEWFKWPLSSQAENLKDLMIQLFEPNVAGKTPKESSIEDLFETFEINRMVELDDNERRAIIYKLMSSCSSECPFSEPAYKISKAEYAAIVLQRQAFGCDHLETGIDFCPICNKNGDKRCLRCGAIATGDICVECNAELGTECLKCGARHISLACCCQPLEDMGVIMECSECCGTFTPNELYIRKVCGCFTHWWCFIRDREIGKIMCGKCGKQEVDDKEVAALQIQRFQAWIADNSATKLKEKVKFFSYKCNICEHISVDTLAWLCHRCSSPDVRQYEPVYITHAQADELLRNEFMCEVGGALQEFCSFISDHKIQCLYQGFLNRAVPEVDEEEEEEEEFCANGETEE